jgi:serine/threonine protein kinase
MPVIRPEDFRPSLPESLVAICRKCLSKDPDARFQTVQELRSAMADVYADPGRGSWASDDAIVTPT